MSEPIDQEDRVFALAEKVAAVLASVGVDCAVIGAAAMAAHNYVRSTDDLDIGTDADLVTQLRVVAKRLRDDGFDVELREPDADDPLGGVLDVRDGKSDLVQVVNFLNPYRRPNLVATEAIRTAVGIEGTTLRAVDLPFLVALKLQAGGPKSRNDLLGLLPSNIERLCEVCDVCDKYRLGKDLDAVLKELGLRRPVKPA